MKINLGEVCTARSSLVDPTTEEFMDLPHIAPDSIERDSGRLLNFRSASEDGVTSGKYRFETGDVLYSKIRPYLNKVAIAGFSGLCSADMYALVVDGNRAIPQFVAHLLRSPDFLEYSASLSNRANIPKLNRKQLMQYEFELPSLEDQRRIAGILDQADAIRAKRRQVLAHLHTLTESIFHEMFSMAKFDSFEFGSLAEEMRNGVSPSTRGAVAGTVLTLSAITHGEFDPSATKPATFDSRPSGTVRVDSRDFLICRGNGNKSLVGVGVRAGKSRPNLVFPDTVIAARISDDLVDLSYLEAVWRQPGTRRQIEAAARTTNGTYKVNQKALSAIRIPLPPPELQREFAARMREVDAQRQRVRRALEAGNELFASLQARAFRGEL